MLEYWLASKFGQLWLTLHKHLRLVLGEMPGECARVARGHQLSAERLYRVQRFAASAWWRVGMVAVALLFPVIGIGALVRPGRVGTDVGAGIMILAVCISAIAMLQMGLLSFRSGQIRWHLAKAGPQAADEPPPPGSLGLPTRWDVWVMLIVAVTVFGILLYAGTR